MEGSDIYKGGKYKKIKLGMAAFYGKVARKQGLRLETYVRI